MKKLAIICTLVSVLLLGTSAGIVLADMSFAGRSEDNHLDAKVYTSGEGMLWLYDNDEERQSVVFNSLNKGQVDTDYVDAGWLKVENDSDEDLWTRVTYEGPGCGTDSQVDCEWVVKVTVEDTNEVYYEGDLDYMGTGDIGFDLPARESRTLLFEVKTAWKLSETDMTEVDFNMAVIGIPKM